jgi:hypothetical protein
MGNLRRVAIAALLAVAAVSLGQAQATAETGPRLTGDEMACPFAPSGADLNAARLSADPRAAECGPAHEVTAAMTDCVEIVLPRAARSEVLRPLVPERYGLFTIPGTSFSRIFVADTFCEDVTVHGRHSAVSTTTYVLASLSSIDGQPATALYVLYIGTSNPQLFALYRSAGLPVDFLRTSSTTITQPSPVTTQVVFQIQGGEFDHTFSVLGPPPIQPYVFDRGGTYVYEGRQGPVTLAWVNEQEPVAPAIVTGFIEAGTSLAELLATPLTLSNVRFPMGFRTGGHTLTLTCVSA